MKIYNIFTKKCCRCKKIKSDDQFNFKNKSSRIKHKSCKDCTREQIRKHYANNKEYYLKKARLRNKLQRETVKKYIWNHLIKNPCVDCGEKDPIVLDFDHQKDKIAPISAFIKLNHSIKKLEKEISKCVVRCANCHRRKTAKDFNWYKHKYASVA